MKYYCHFFTFKFTKIWLFSVLHGKHKSGKVAENAFTFLQTILDAGLERCSWEKVFWKYAANLQENTHAEVWFQ